MNKDYFWLGDMVCEVLDPQPVRYEPAKRQRGILYRLSHNDDSPHGRQAFLDRCTKHVKPGVSVDRVCPFCRGSGKFVPGEFVKDEIEGLPCYKCGGHIKTYSLGIGLQRICIKSVKVMQAKNLMISLDKEHMPELAIKLVRGLVDHGKNTLETWLSVSKEMEGI